MTARGWFWDWPRLLGACGFVLLTLLGARPDGGEETAVNRKSPLAAKKPSAEKSSGEVGNLEGRVTFVGEVPKSRIAAIPGGEYQLILSQPDVQWRHEQRVVIVPQKTAPVELDLKRSDLKDF